MLKQSKMTTVYYIGGALIALWLIRHMHRRGKTICVRDENCTGCRKCIKKCRHKVLAPASEEKGAHVFVTNQEKCTACGDCISVCKFNALEMTRKF
jgi:NAD-dependent dihydropyrimidine dehydrogenase PreA subunit